MKSRIFHLLMAVMMFAAATVYAAEPNRLKTATDYILKTKMPVVMVEVIHAYPHDGDAYTQGLFIHDNYLYESTGIYGRSGLFKKDIETGKILQETRIDKNYFGEGAVLFKNKIYQLTWQSETLMIYDHKSFNELKKIHYEGEGWGLTTDGRYLFMSNGSSTLSVRDPKSFKVIRQIHVRDGETPIERLNELEMINGEIWANIYMEDFVVRIAPKSGNVKGWIDLSSLRKHLPAHAQVDVINGIAWDKKNDRIFVTGKLWPKLFEIKLKEGTSKKP